MKRKNCSPEFEAHLEAIGALRESAETIETAETYMLDEENKKWKLSEREMRKQHARAAARRDLANQLEIEALRLAHKQKSGKRTR